MLTHETGARCYRREPIWVEGALFLAIVKIVKMPCQSPEMSLREAHFYLVQARYFVISYSSLVRTQHSAMYVPACYSKSEHVCGKSRSTRILQKTSQNFN